jgi:hypothetical protein
MYSNEFEKIRKYFDNINPTTDFSTTKHVGLRLIEILIEINQENHLLREKVKKYDENYVWLQKKANEWMLKSMEKQ